MSLLSEMSKHAEQRRQVKVELQKAAEPSKRNYDALQKHFWLNQNKHYGSIHNLRKKLHSV